MATKKEKEPQKYQVTGLPTLYISSYDVLDGDLEKSIEFLQNLRRKIYDHLSAFPNKEELFEKFNKVDQIILDHDTWDNDTEITYRLYATETLEEVEERLSEMRRAKTLERKKENVRQQSAELKEKELYETLKKKYG